MSFKDFFAKRLKGDQDFKNLQKQVRNEKIVAERMKNSNERELDRFHEEERQEMIKRELEIRRKQRQSDLWHSNTMRQDSITKNENQILKQPSMFQLKSDNLKGNGMFFK